MNTPPLSLRHLKPEDIHLILNNRVKEERKQVTEEWLQGKIEEMNLEFRYFITLTFNRQQTCVINQYLDNKHIKNVILSFFYPNNKPKKRIRMWFFVEKHKNGRLHLHFLLEGMNGLNWLLFNNRKVTLKKSTIYDILSGEYFIEDVITETLTNHLNQYIRKLGNGKQGVDIRLVGDIEKRVQYVNKSLNDIDFSQWEHIDFVNSDL